MTEHNPNPPSPPSESEETPRVIARPRRRRRVRTPTVLQMESVECGAACLGMILGYYGKFVPLEELRVACGVSRDGSKAKNVLQAARRYGLEAKAYRREPEQLYEMDLPVIVHWNFNHFLVVEGVSRNRIYLNDPVVGPRSVSVEEFDQSFTGVVMTFQPSEHFQRDGRRSGLLGGLWKRLNGSRTAFLFVVLISLALVIPGLAIPAFSQIFVDNILVQGQDWLIGLLGAMALTALVQAGLTWMQQYYLLRLETKLALASSAQFLWHILRLPIEFFAQRYDGEISFRIAINDRVAHLLAGELATAALSIILVLFYGALMFIYNVELALISIAITFINIIILQIVSRRRVDANQRLLHERGKLLGAAVNGLQTIETIKATGSEDDFFSRWAGYQAKSLNAEQEFALSTQLLSVVPPFLTALNTAALLFWGGVQVMEGTLTMGRLVAFQTLLISFVTPVNQIVNLGGRFQEAVGDMARLDDALRYETDPQISASPTGFDITITRHETDTVSTNGKLAGYVELRNITFGYSRLEAPLIENFSLTIQPGARVALVGGSGSGKSTIARLVTGLYEPWEGEILFDGIPRRQIPRDILANSLTMVDQEIFMFEGTIRDNITLWDPTIPETNIITAAKDASIHDDITERPGGYDFLVEEGGRNFSGGQRQRLEIARALVGNPSILVLDEATSALDPITEKEIDSALRRRGCTCLIIAHRLSTIRDCDEIIVLDRGQVVQRGTHDEMHKVPGPYADLIQAEAVEAEMSRAYQEYLF